MLLDNKLFINTNNGSTWEIRKNNYILIFDFKKELSEEVKELIINNKMFLPCSELHPGPCSYSAMIRFD